MRGPARITVLAQLAQLGADLWDFAKSNLSAIKSLGIADESTGPCSAHIKLSTQVREYELKVAAHCSPMGGAGTFLRAFGAPGNVLPLWPNTFTA